MGSLLYVGNLSFSTSSSSLSDLFLSHGFTVRDVRLAEDRLTGQARGFGWVMLADHVEAAKAISALDGAMLDGRFIRVNEAPERQPSGGGGGGFGGRGGGGGGRGGGGRGGRGGGGRDRY